MLLVFYGMLAGVSDPARSFRRSSIACSARRPPATACINCSTGSRPSPNRARPVQVPRHCRDLVFDKVDFSYRAGQAVLEDINLRIAAGETVAIVGPNGCGKSTLANLIPRFFDPAAGRCGSTASTCAKCGCAICASKSASSRRRPSCSTTRCTTTFATGRRRATREQVVEAAKRRHAQVYRRTARAGYDTIVGKQGGRLSGGQRQRIALARAILRDPAILILDEATSQIDIESEQLIHRVAGRICPRPDDGDYHPSTGHAGAGRSDRGDGGRPDHRCRPPPRTDRPLPAVSAALPDRVSPIGLIALSGAVSTPRGGPCAFIGAPFAFIPNIACGDPLDLWVTFARAGQEKSTRLGAGKQRDARPNTKSHIKL